MCVSANNMNNSPDNAKSKITINGGTVTSQNESAIFVPDNTEVLIEPKDGKDVNISGLRSAIAIDKGNLTIKGGTFETRFTTETILPGTSGTNGFPLAVIAAPCYYGNVSVSVEGGTFKGVSGISTAKVGSRVEQGSDYTTTVSVTGGDWQDPEIFGYAGANAKINVTMSADREIKEAIRIANGTVASIDFNGFTITNRTEISGGKYPSSHGFLINGNGTEVTFNNTASTSGGIKIDGSGSDKDAYRQAMIISDNAKVTINGGKFYNVQKQITQLDLIQVSLGGNDDKASLTINGGEFESGCYSTYSNKIRYWVLNILNESKDTSSIKVNGGSFVNFNPARPEMDDQDTYLGEGKTVVVEGSENINVDKPYYEVISDKNNPQRLVYTVK